MQGEDLIESLDAGSEFVGVVILNQIPEFFDRIEFGAVGWKKDQVDPGGDIFMGVVIGMKADPVPDDNVLIIWILFFGSAAGTLRSTAD